MHVSEAGRPAPTKGAKTTGAVLMSPWPPTRNIGPGRQPTCSMETLSTLDNEAFPEAGAWGADSCPDVGATLVRLYTSRFPPTPGPRGWVRLQLARRAGSRASEMGSKARCWARQPGPLWGNDNVVPYDNK
jgi:hypothetical protein